MEELFGRAGEIQLLCPAFVGSPGFQNLLFRGFVRKGAVNSGEMAVPAIVYALVMNVVLLSYLKLLPKCTDETASEGA